MALEHRITCQIPHNIRMALGILADSIGASISTYVRGILENYANGEDVKRPIPSYLGKHPDANTWHRVAIIMHQAGDDAHITIRVTDRVLSELDDTKTYNRSTLIRSLIMSHIYRNMPTLPMERVKEIAGELQKITKKCKNECARITGEAPILRK